MTKLKASTFVVNRVRPASNMAQHAKHLRKLKRMNDADNFQTTQVNFSGAQGSGNVLNNDTPNSVHATHDITTSKTSGPQKEAHKLLVSHGYHLTNTSSIGTKNYNHPKNYSVSIYPEGGWLHRNNNKGYNELGHSIYGLKNHLSRIDSIDQANNANLKRAAEHYSLCQEHAANGLYDHAKLHKEIADRYHKLGTMNDKNKPIESSFESIATDGKSKYDMSKVKRDHDNFVKVLGKHYQNKNKKPTSFDWQKIMGKQYVVHRFSHKHPAAPLVRIKRAHNGDEPLYHVLVKMPYYDHKAKEAGGGRAVYRRKISTKKPSLALDKMLQEGIAAQHAGKNPRTKITSSMIVEARTPQEASRLQENLNRSLDHLKDYHQSRVDHHQSCAKKCESEGNKESCEKHNMIADKHEKARQHYHSLKDKVTANNVGSMNFIANIVKSSLDKLEEVTAAKKLDKTEKKYWKGIQKKLAGELLDKAVATKKPATKTAKLGKAEYKRHLQIANKGSFDEGIKSATAIKNHHLACKEANEPGDHDKMIKRCNKVIVGLRRLKNL
jgi:hypothetical protein